MHSPCVRSALAAGFPAPHRRCRQRQPRRREGTACGDCGVGVLSSRHAIEPARPGRVALQPAAWSGPLAHEAVACGPDLARWPVYLFLIPLLF
jgi:hypothetical protein